MAILVLLGAALVAFGVWMHAMMPVPLGTPRDTEIYSFDYLKYANTLSDVRFIGYGRFRHPLFAWITSVVTAVGQRVLEVLGEPAFWIYLCVVFSAVVLGAVALLYRCLRKVVGLDALGAAACTALFVSFAHTWLLAGLPETYPLSLLLSLVVLNWAFARIPDRRIEGVGWGVLAVLSGGITLTQGVKTCLAYCVAKRPTRRQILIGALSLAALIALVVLVFYVRLRIRVSANPGERGMEGAIHELFGPLIGFSHSPGEWLHRVWVFFSEPIIVRGEPFDVRTIDGGYGSFVQPVLLFALYAMAAVGAWMGRRHMLAKLLLTMFLVDVAIHFVLGWGLAESQLYAAHWFYAIPLLVGFSLVGATGRNRHLLLFAVLGLALGIILCNIHGYFCHDVGLVWPEAPADAM